MEYKAKLEKLIETLTGNKSIEIIRDDIGSPTDATILQSVMNAFGIKQLSREIKGLYDELSSCRIEWVCMLDQHPSIEKYHKEDNEVRGIIRIRPVEQFLRYDEKLDAAFWTDNMTTDEKQDLKNFRYFDLNDDYIRVGYLLTEEKSIEDKLYFLIQQSTGFSPAGISLEEYFEKMLYCKGIQGWPYNHFFKESDNYKRMMHYINQLFK